jgi:hypothetical protein
MSGPVDDVPPGSDAPEPPVLEIGASREANVGGMRVLRALPRKGRRTVGAWCFADHLTPVPNAADIGPHPHTGLQTVTWLVEGQLVHRDSLGSEQAIRPGQLNLMTAGNGVAHAEESARPVRGTLHGLQLWVAQPEGTRHGAAAFEHHAELPEAELPGGVATVLVGEYAGTPSPARHDTPLVGADLDLRTGAGVWPLRPDFEHALIVLTGALGIDGETVRPGALAYLGLGRDEIVLDTAEPTRAVLLGGEPFPDTLVMWWNFVARTRAEVDTAYAAWQIEDDRFGRVDSTLPRIPVGAPFWQT